MRHFTLLLCMVFSVAMTAQKKIVWFDAGLKAQYGAGGLYNAAVSSSANYDHLISTGYSYGAKLGINKNYNGLSIDVMRNTAKQEFENKTITTSAPTITTANWSSWDIYTLFRNSQNMGYFEIGPKISLIKKVELSADGVNKTEVTEGFNDKVFSGVIGFGANIMGTEDRFSGILGLRFEYGFTDFNKEQNVATNTSVPVGDVSIYADGYKQSNIAFAGVVFEMNWGIGYYGKAQCGKRPKFIMF